MSTEPAATSTGARTGAADVAGGAESTRLAEDAARTRNWKRWGPYLAERQWGTVREDYSAHGNSWEYFTHDQARSRAYRWGEDGLLGICDREGRLCLALALWNERDDFLKERLFGLTGPEGNHGEDVKEAYFYLDSTPTHSFMRALYKYPLDAFPYARLVRENAARRARGFTEDEFELLDTGVFDGQRYVDVFVEYAKAAPDDVLMRVRLANRAPHAARLHVLPTLWFRNTWSWGRAGQEGYPAKPSLVQSAPDRIDATHATLGALRWQLGPGPDGRLPELLFTENESNNARLFGVPNTSAYVKDAFHRYVVAGESAAVNPQRRGTKAAAHYVLDLPAAGEVVLELRLSAVREAPEQPLGPDFDVIFHTRRAEADAFYAELLPATLPPAERAVARQAYAGLFWSKQFYYYVVSQWLEGDPGQPVPPRQRLGGRNSNWRHVYNRDVISMPDKWEYPWYAAWDLAFHVVAIARADPDFAKQQLLLFLREWYMHPNGQLPAYEFGLGEVNPPVHAWACWRVYELGAALGQRDRVFLERCFHKLLLNFTWWVNRKDDEGNNLFSGGFLGLDNIGVFDRSQALPTGGHLEQADGTAWMAFYAATMLGIALELAREDAVYEDLASKFFEHFVAIADAMNNLGGCGLWDEQDGFYYDQLHVGSTYLPLRVRSLVGLAPLFALALVDDDLLERLPGFRKRLEWFLTNRPELAGQIAHTALPGGGGQRLLAIAGRERLERVLRYMLDEREFLAPGGLRSLSRFHAAQPYVFQGAGQEYRVDYAPAESRSGLFGGNSNWRGPVWLPMNYLLIEALERYHQFYGGDFQVEYPSGSGQRLDLRAIARALAARLAGIFLPDVSGRRPCHGDDARFAQDPHWRDLVLFYEYFSGDDSRGVGASHQTGWTALVVCLLERLHAGPTLDLHGCAASTPGQH
jgi:hypothetical protein